MKKYVDKLHRIVKDRSGTTMVEVLVGFTILTIFMAAFFQVISFSGNLMNKSVDNFKKEETFEAEYYKKTSIPKQVTGSGPYTLQVDRDKTKPANNANNEIKLSLLNIQLEEYEDQNTGMHRYSFTNNRDVQTNP